MTNPQLRLFRRICCASTLSLLLLGCGWLDDESEEAEGELPVPLSIDEMLDADAETQTGFQLQVGERFPLKKTVDQRLVQGGIQSHSRLELWLQIGVAEHDGDQTRLEARFLDVRYEHQIGDQRVAFDSRSVTGMEHVETRAYRGLVNNQFSFWIDADHQFVRLDEDFQTFLEQCVAGVPASQRDAAYSRHSTHLGRRQLTSFLDESIGVLPAGDLRELQQWTRPLTLPEPLPDSVELTCTLRTLKDKSAVVELSAMIPSAPAQPVFVRGRQQPAVTLQVLGGQCRGECLVDRETGLPLNSRQELLLDLVAILPDGSRLPQQKTITTRVEAFPETAPDFSLPSFSSASREAASESERTAQGAATQGDAAESQTAHRDGIITGLDAPSEIPSAQY